jgi:ribosomal protein S18 acetylase RimI-like enzyme
VSQPREYRGEEDYQRVRDLLIESYAITGRMHNWGVDCWDWFRFNGHVFEELDNSRRWERDLGLWETASGKLVGVAIVDGGELDLQIHPDHRHLEADMLAWSKRHHLASRPGGKERWPLSIYVYDYDLERQVLLEGIGFENSGHDGYMRRRPVRTSLPVFRLPQEYSIRSIDPGDRQDLDRRAAIANSAFDVAKHTDETIEALQNAPTYRPELDLVVVGPDGLFAAYCIVWFDAANRIGMIGPVGVDPAHRRRGLARAMMSEALRQLQALQAGTAYVDCDLDIAANRLYQSVGFTDYDRVFHWRKEF